MFLKKINLTTDQRALIEVLSEPPYPKEVTKQMYDLIFIKNFSFHQLFPDLPNDAMEETYLIAKTYYESGNYKDAFPLFYTLVLYDHHNYGYVLGSAACLHLLGNYALAAKGYSLAYAADTSNPTPLFYAAECLEKIKQYEAAIFLLGMAIAISSNKKEYKTLKEQAILNQAALKKLNLGGK